MIKKTSVFLCIFSTLLGQVSISDIDKLSNSQLDEIRSKLQVKTSNETSSSKNNAPQENLSTVGINAQKSKTVSEVYFGYSYFKRDINFFDNIPTPPDFKLGPGDEIILSLWGEINLREKFIINKEGLIYYENIGFVNISNKTIEEAQEILTKELSNIYSTLGDKENPTELMIEIGKLKSINVYFSGQITNPGIHLIHPFSDIFSAIVQSGGINKQGSLRKVELIRSNKVIDTIDFYSFFKDGKSDFSTIRILDGDVIHIPEVSIRCEIQGEVVTGGFFELLESESVSNLIDYSGGFSSTASSSGILDIIIPVAERSSDDNARISNNIDLNESKNIKITNGSMLKILSIGEVETKVEVFGRVKLPGKYSANSTLKQVLDIAGGFDDPIYRKTIRDDEIVVLRKDENQFYGLELKMDYSESSKFKLAPGDKIFVYENNLYDNLFTISVSGEVNKRGTYQLKQGTTVQDAIQLAEGFSPLANKEAITVSEFFSSVDQQGQEVQEKRQVKDANLDFELTNGSIINVLPLENVVSVEGNVYNPGLITYAKAKTVNKYINLAGGPKPNTLSTKIYVQRANGRIKKVTFFQGIGTIVKPGDTIVVPLDPDPSDFDITRFIADLASTLANIAAILVIIDNQND